MGRSLKEDVYCRLKEEILYGQFNPNVVLTEGEIAQKFLVSRTPARQALQKLENENMIKRNSTGCGWTIYVVRLEEIHEMLELDCALVDLMIHHTMERITEKSVLSLEKQLEQIGLLVEQREIHHAADLCRQFRISIMEEAKMPLVMKVWLSIPPLCNFNWLWNGIPLEKHLHSIADNRVLMEAIKERDALKFEKTYRRHTEEYFEWCTEVYQRFRL